MTKKNKLIAVIWKLSRIPLQERREKYRKQAYAQKHKDWTVKGNRRRLWEAYTKESEK